MGHHQSGLLSLPESTEKGKRRPFFARIGKIINILRKREMAEMYLTIFDQVEQVDQEALEVEAASLYRAFEQVKDRRGKKGKRYP